MTDKLPKTIQFFLPQGEPRGIRIADITTRIVQAVLVPRSKLSAAAKRRGGLPFDKCRLYNLLTNVLYAGKLGPVTCRRRWRQRWGARRAFYYHIFWSQQATSTAGAGCEGA